MDGIKGAVAVVTGAAQGNGAAIARGLAQSGARVMLADLQSDAVEQVAADIRTAGGDAQSAHVDVADRASASDLAAAVANHFGAAEILVNNAGVIRRTPIGSETFDEDFQAVMAVNTGSVATVTRAFLDQLKQTKGRVINLGSIMSITAGPGMTAYAGSKGAVAQMTKALAHDLAPDGVRVNALAPGVIETPMTEATRANPEAIGRFMAHTPMGRPGLAEELVGPTLFLASHMSSYVTGAVLPVDGGYLAS